MRTGRKRGGVQLRTFTSGFVNGCALVANAGRPQPFLNVLAGIACRLFRTVYFVNAFWRPTILPLRTGVLEEFVLTCSCSSCGSLRKSALDELPSMVGGM